MTQEEVEYIDLRDPKYVNTPAGYGLVLNEDAERVTVLQRVGRVYKESLLAPVMIWKYAEGGIEPERKWQRVLRWFRLIKVA